jgi:hypothetical protein
VRRLQGFAGKRSTPGWRALSVCALALLGVGLSVVPGAARETAGGTVVAWGCRTGTDFGQCSVPAGLSGVTAIAAGTYHSVALKSDGSVVAWGCQSTLTGNPNFGQCNVPEGLSGVTAIAAGYAHSLALKIDRTVAAWGCGAQLNEGQCTVPDGLSDVTAIAADIYHSLALVTGTPAIALLGAKASGRLVSLRAKISNWKMYPALSGKKPNKPDGGHWRIYVDGRYNNSSTQPTTGKTTKLKPGTHRTWVILANNDDTAVAGTQRSKTLTVVVKKSS